MSDSQSSHSTKESDQIFVKDLVGTCLALLAHWPVLLMSASLGIGAAALVNRYTEDQFEVRATVAVEESENPLASAEGLLNLGFSWGGNGIVDTRMAVLSSYAHNLRVAKNLNWGLKYYNSGRLNRREVYLPHHFRVEYDYDHPQLLGVEFSLDLGLEGYKLETLKKAEAISLYLFNRGKGEENWDGLLFEEAQTEHRYGEWIESEFYRFRVMKGPGLVEFLKENPSATSSFEFESLDAVANWALENQQYEHNDKKQSSLLTLSMEGPLKAKMVDYINASIDELQLYELRQKNAMAVNTMTFIDEQLLQIEESLRSSEGALEQFRADNLIVDLSSESAQMLEYFIELEQEKASLDLQRSFYAYVLEFLEKKDSYAGLSLPTLSSFNDPLVVQLANKLVETSVNLESVQEKKLKVSYTT